MGARNASGWVREGEREKVRYRGRSLPVTSACDATAAFLNPNHESVQLRGHAI